MPDISTDIHVITSDIQEWLQGVHPDRTPDQVFSKLEEELAELRDRPTDAWEWADVFILVFDLCEILGIDPAKAIHWKMQRNRQRTWEIDNEGKLQHINEETTNA